MAKFPAAAQALAARADQKIMIVTLQAAAAHSRQWVLKMAVPERMLPVTGAAEMEVIERISRVLAGQYFSRNATGAAGDDNASALVDQNWVDFQEDAIAVLKTLRQPPTSLTNENDAALWGLVINSVLGPHADR